MLQRTRVLVTEDSCIVTEDVFLVTGEVLLVVEDKVCFFVYRLVLDAKPVRVDAVAG